MQTILLATAAAATASAAEIMRPAGGAQINNDDHIAFLNEHATSWKAGVNARFEGLTYDETRALLGTHLSPRAEELAAPLPANYYANITSVPDEFNSVTNWKGLVQPIRDQAQCGSCWAFSAAEVLGDRFGIKAGKAEPVLSPEDLVSCDSGDMGCSGGQLPNAWKYLQSTGVVTDACMPYVAGTGTAGKCLTKCADNSKFTKYKAASSYPLKTVADMQKDILANGPIQVAFEVYKSFMSYTSGVYAKNWYELIPEGGHAVKIVGWGTEDSKDYWLVANSWGTSWGLEGYFKIARGSDACGMESMGPPYAGLPAL